MATGRNRAGRAQTKKHQIITRSTRAWFTKNQNALGKDVNYHKITKKWAEQDN